MSKQPLLSIQNLTISYIPEEEKRVDITDNVSFDIQPGQIFGLVGESGCGKTITALSIIKLLPKPIMQIRSGKIILNGKDLAALSVQELRKVRNKEVGVIFQEPTAALNPLLTVKRQLMELFEYHSVSFDKEKRIADLFKRVGFAQPKRILSAYPHQLSGGMLQRVMIAMALLLEPSLIIADEPTTALDVTIQAQIMELVVQMQRQTGTSILLITHNLNLIAQYADYLAVMYAGRIVEQCNVEAFLDKQLHPYSQGLLRALPDLNVDRPELQAIAGQVPQLNEYVAGCRFKDRCPNAFHRCSEKPHLYDKEGSHKVACFLYQ